MGIPGILADNSYGAVCVEILCIHSSSRTVTASIGPGVRSVYSLKGYSAQLRSARRVLVFHCWGIPSKLSIDSLHFSAVRFVEVVAENWAIAVDTNT